jgi:hypothetical protein
MLVETIDVITMTQGELQKAIIEAAEAQSGRKVLKAKVEIIWSENAPAEIRADGTQWVEGVRISGVMKAEKAELKCAEG